MIPLKASSYTYGFIFHTNFSVFSCSSSFSFTIVTNFACLLTLTQWLDVEKVRIVWKEWKDWLEEFCSHPFAVYTRKKIA